MVRASLGLDHCNDLMVPQLTIEIGKPIKKIVCGGNHTLLLFEDGELQGCGDSTMGQLGDPSIRGWHSIFKGKLILDVACGWEFTVVIGSDNKVYSSGVGSKGELGLGDSHLKCSSFRKVMEIPEGYNGKLYASLQNCVLVLRKDDHCQVYGWGSNTKEQLGKPKSRRITQPTLIYESKLKLVEHVAMGKHFMIYLDKRQTIFSTQGSLPEEFLLKDWLDRPNVSVSCMWTSIHISYEGKIYSFGNDRYKQLFHNDQIGDTLKIQSFTTGSEHGILALTDNQVYCWGWGEHGNCGSGSTAIPITAINNLSNITSDLALLPLSLTSLHKNIRLFGGCATTWVVVDF